MHYHEKVSLIYVFFSAYFVHHLCQFTYILVHITDRRQQKLLGRLMYLLCPIPEEGTRKPTRTIGIGDDVSSIPSSASRHERPRENKNSEYIYGQLAKSWAVIGKSDAQDCRGAQLDQEQKTNPGLWRNSHVQTNRCCLAYVKTVGTCLV